MSKVREMELEVKSKSAEMDSMCALMDASVEKWTEEFEKRESRILLVCSFKVSNFFLFSHECI